jgi:hypothetical protein
MSSIGSGVCEISLNFIRIFSFS